MTVLMVPTDAAPWPSLGGQVCAWIEENLVFGPGDLRGEPAVLDAEKRALIWRMYEVYAEDHPQAGRRRFKRVGLSLAKGLAKALALDTPLPTPTGWTTMGDVQPEDLLIGSDGRPCRVTAVSPVFLNRPCFRVAFSDGTAIVADAEHRWFTQTRVGHRGGEGVFTTAEIRDTLYWHPTKPYCNHRIPLAAPLSLPDAALPIDPYMLGAWLGDGRSDDSAFTLHENDLPNLREQVQRAGYFMGEPKADSRRTTTLAVRVSMTPIGGANNNGKLTLKGALREAGLLDNKHIPSVYLRSSFSQRLALLQGLMDTDGSVSVLKSNARCEFTSTNRTLADGVMELCRTLGLRPMFAIGRSKRNGRDHGAYYRVGFTPRDDVPAFRLIRKADLSVRTAMKTSQALSRTIRAVDPVESVPVKCVAVDTDDHLYLAGDGMVPTHNTELAAWIAAAELHPDAPVRTVGWDGHGKPIGGPVTDPYIPLVAYTEEQSDELAYGALRCILDEGPLRNDFDIGLERIMRRAGDGKAVSLAAAPNARDGARTTFSVADETHWHTLPRLKQAHMTMLANLPKRRIADAWMLETTTAYEPGSGSVAEDTMDYARAVNEGRVRDSRLFFFHRQASDHDLTTEAGVRAAVIEASGPAAAWRDIDGIAEMFRDPSADRVFLERVWCNRIVKGSRRAFDVQQWAELHTESPVNDGDLITLGFDGSLFHDATGLVATQVETGYQWVAGLWENEQNRDDWQVDDDAVDDVVGAMFERYQVWRMYADPSYWDAWLSKWAGQFGADRVVEFHTNAGNRMLYALKSFRNAIQSGALSHDGDANLTRHIGNAYVKELNRRDEEGNPFWVIQKERPNSPFKIDLAMAAVLSWDARNDAIAAGAGNARPSIYETRGLMSV